MSFDLIDLLNEAYPDRTIVALSTRPYAYATSFALAEIHVRFDDGGVEQLILKDFARDHMLANARSSRPAFLDDPGREIATYRSILAPQRIGPRCVATVTDRRVPRHWLICEKSPGAELWQIGDLDVWRAVARWAAAFHRRFADQRDQLLAANPALFRHDRHWFTMWADRAREALARSSDGRAAALIKQLGSYDAVAHRLAELPPTLVHGEMYPANVLVGGSGEAIDVCPVDWEMAAVGPAMIDIAALVSGWDPATTESLLSAYGALPGSLDDLDRCRLHLALQWLGWSSGWRPPVSQAHDWLHEALRLAEVVMS